MTKKFKAETPLTNYPMLKFKNSTVLTNNISHKNDQILIPNIENNITEQVNTEHNKISMYVIQTKRERNKENTVHKISQVPRHLVR